MSPPRVVALEECLFHFGLCGGENCFHSLSLPLFFMVLEYLAGHFLIKLIALLSFLEDRTSTTAGLFSISRREAAGSFVGAPGSRNIPSLWKKSIAE